MKIRYFYEMDEVQVPTWFGLSSKTQTRYRLFKGHLENDGMIHGDEVVTTEVGEKLAILLMAATMDVTIYYMNSDEQRKDT